MKDLKNFLPIIIFCIICQSCRVPQHQKHGDNFTITFAGPFVDTQVRLLLDDHLLLDSTLTTGMDGVAHSIFLIPSPRRAARLRLIVNAKEYGFTIPKNFSNYLIIDYFPGNNQFKLSDKDFPRMQFLTN